MNDKITYIPLDMIKPIAKLHTSDAYLKRMKILSEKTPVYDLLLAVETMPDCGQFRLAGGYDRYAYMLSAGIKIAPCIIEVESTPGNLYLKAINRLFNSGASTKSNRQIILDHLRKLSISQETIICNTGLTKSDLKNNYSFKPSIPQVFINDNTTISTINWIEGLPIGPEVKNFLYESAALPLRNPKRLTNDSVKLIKKFLKHEKRFYCLIAKQQIYILQNAINKKEPDLSDLKTMVDKCFKLKKII